MLNGWFTIVAQAINFLILVWLLKRFLYKPILQAIDAREKGIAAQLASAVAQEAAARKERDDLHHKSDIFDNEKSALLTKATDDANVERKRLIDAAKKDSDALRVSRQLALQAEVKQLDQKIVRWTQDQVFAITRKTLADLASPSLESRITDVFIVRLRAMSGPSKAQLSDALKKSPCLAIVRSVIELPPPQRTAIQAAIDETFDTKVKLQFQTAPDLIAGIELAANGQKVTWSIAHYLKELGKSVGELLGAEDKSESKPDVKLRADSPPVVRPKPVVKAATTTPNGIS